MRFACEQVRRFPVAREIAAFRRAGVTETGDRRRVVVVGGGFGGLPACRFLGTSRSTSR